MIWNWGWTWKSIDVENSEVAIDATNEADEEDPFTGRIQGIGVSSKFTPLSYSQHKHILF
jgi:hypothetical protein